MWRFSGLLLVFLACGSFFLATIGILTSGVSESVRHIGAQVKELRRRIQPMVSTSYTGQNGQTHTVETHREDGETFDQLLERHAQELASMKEKFPEA